MVHFSTSIELGSFAVSFSVDFAHIRGEVVRDGGSASRRGPMA
jgi:hypothetical protein